MGKYWLVLKNQFSLLSTYRLELFFRWIMNFFDVVIYVALWSLAYQGDQQQINKLIIYFSLYYGIFNNIHTGRIANWMSKDINTGQINNFLIKPINFPLVQFLKSLTVVFVRILSPMIIIIGGSIFFPKIFSPVSFSNLLLFFLFLLMGMAIWNLGMISIASIAFRGTEIRSLLTTVDLILNLLKGAYIPAYIFPAFFTKILSFTFVPYLASFPIKLYQELIPPKEIWMALLTGTAWIIIFGIIAKKSYQAGLKIYEAQGG